jgi:hypothetical protein
VAGTAASQAELPARLADMAEVSSAQASAGRTARMAPRGKAQRRSSRCGEAGGNGSTWLSSAVAQDDASPLEHRTRDVRPGWSQTERKRAQPWRCDSARSRRKRGRGKRGVPAGCTTQREEAGPGRAQHVARQREGPGASSPQEQWGWAAVRWRGR